MAGIWAGSRGLASMTWMASPHRGLPGEVACVQKVRRAEREDLGWADRGGWGWFGVRIFSFSYVGGEPIDGRPII